MIIAITLFLLGIVLLIFGCLEDQTGSIFFGIFLIIIASLVMQARVDNEVSKVNYKQVKEALYKEKAPKVRRCDYGIELHNDTIWLYSEDTFVGRVLNKWNSPLDSLIEEDNK